MTGVLCILAASQTEIYLDRQLVTVGGTGTSVDENRKRGFSSGSFGSIVDGTSDIYSGASIQLLYWDESAGQVYFTIFSGTATNTGWTTLTIGSTKLSRTSATYNVYYTIHTWTWNVGSSPFGVSTGQTITCTFT